MGYLSAVRRPSVEALGVQLANALPRGVMFESCPDIPVSPCVGFLRSVGVRRRLA
jgi:hypothetical protein